MTSLRFLLTVVWLATGGAAAAQVGPSTCTNNTPCVTTPYTGGGSGVVNPTVVTGVPAASTSIASTVTTAGTFQSATPANTARKGCFIQNTSSYIEYIYLGATGSATLTNATQIQPGGTFTCAAPFGVVADANVAITVATGGSGATYVGWIQ